MSWTSPGLGGTPAGADVGLGRGTSAGPTGGSDLHGSSLMSRFAELPNHPASDPNGRVMVLPPPRKPSRRDIWMKRVWLILFVLLSLEVGIVLVICPWTTIWSENSLVLGMPRLRELLMSNFVRGAVTGLGLVNIGTAIVEAIRYRERE